MFYRVDDTADWKFELGNDHWNLFGAVSHQNRRVNKRLGWSIVHRSIKCVRFRNFRVGVELAYTSEPGEFKLNTLLIMRVRIYFRSAQVYRIIDRIQSFKTWANTWPLSASYEGPQLTSLKV
jgi:hypothetical protein